MFGLQPDGSESPAAMDLVRLAFPRRVYTQSHVDYLAEVILERERAAGRPCPATASLAGAGAAPLHGADGAHRVTWPLLILRQDINVFRQQLGING